MQKTRSSRLAFLSMLSVALASPACHSGEGGTGGGHTTGSSKSSTGSASAGGMGGMGAAPAFTADDISKQPASTAESEPTVVVGKNGVVAAAWNGFAGAPRIGYAFSTDGGKTWMPPAVASPSDTFGYGDPTMAAADDGTLYLAFVGFSQGFTQGRVMLAKAAPGATSFDVPVVITDPAKPGPYDKPVITITKDQAIIVSYTDVSSDLIGVARSTDGATFTRTTAGKPAVGSTLSSPCAAVGGGRLWVVFLAGASVQLRWSDDDGVTFPMANASRVSLASETDLSSEDPVCVGRGNDVWVAYGRSHDMLDPSSFNYLDYALRFAHSTDGGATFTVQDVHDTSAGSLYMEPALAIEPSGALDLAYYAGSKADDPAGSFRFARSTDGASFAPTTVISSPFLFTGKRSSLSWPGDYMTIVPAGGRLVTAFSHNSVAPGHISFASLPLP